MERTDLTMIKDKYKKYIIDRHPIPDSDPDVPQYILDSWRRCLTYPVADIHHSIPAINKKNMDALLIQNKFLLNVAHPYLIDLYQYLTNTGIILSLSDKNGIIIDFVGDNETLSTIGENTDLYLGSRRDEIHSGTSGIALCLILKRPIQVCGSEHFCPIFHNTIGTAAPIKDTSGNIIGNLGSVVPLEQADQNYILAMISSTANSISKELSLKQSLQKIEEIKSQLSIIVENIQSGVLFIDNEGSIILYNHAAVELIGSFQNILRRNINDFLIPKSSGKNITELKKNIQNVEYLVSGNHTQKNILSVSVSLVYGNEHQTIGKLVILEELKKLHQLAGKISGFHATYTFDSIIGKSADIIAAKNTASTIANSSSNVLILGESGVGKELFAQAIHNASSRARKPFVAINCGSLPKELIESELFGYVPGAFTGASKTGQPGKFELANGGTIFLDEIGDMPLALQTSLLRVLQTRSITRIGDTHQKSIDVRVITATNVNLLKAVENKDFRNDLYYRLNVLSIEIPPLRTRTSDIPLLSLHFLEMKNQKLRKNVTNITDDAMEVLCQYNWPGNIRELENVIERAVNLSDNCFIDVKNLPDNIVRKHSCSDNSTNIESINEHAPDESYPEISNQQKFLLELTAALQKEKGNITNVAKSMNIPKRTLYRKIKKYQININDFRF